MARFKVPTDRDKAEWHQWVESRPAAIRGVIARFEPWTLYRLKSTGQRVFVVGFDETDAGLKVRVGVTGEFNYLSHDREVFGIDPGDLEETSLPEPGERLGTFLPDSVTNDLDQMRVLIRPDLWEMGSDGKAVRRMLH